LHSSTPGTFTNSNSLTPSDSISQLATLKRPAIRPAEYSASILWTFDDAKADKTVVASTSNPSRPNMRNAIRNADGSPVSPGEWKCILASARIIINDLLMLPVHGEHANARKTKEFFRHHHPRAWQAALEKLDRLQPLVSLCALHWKSEHILMSLLQRRPPGTNESGDTDDTNDFDSDIVPSNRLVPSKRSNPAPMVTKRAKTRLDSIGSFPDLSTPITSAASSSKGPIDTSYIFVDPTLDHLEGELFFYA
jgi:hypothetical protein